MFCLVADCRDSLLDGIHARTTFVECALGINKHNLFDLRMNQKPCNGNTGSSGAIDDNREISNLFAGYTAGIDDSRHGNDCSTVLIIMENRD